jgi:L-threonylcarbamoyladenylate synthase
MREEIEKTVEVLKSGGIILCPTDTVWGIGCDATNSEAVKRIYEIKKRMDLKSMLILIDSVNRLGDYVKEVPEIAFDLIELSTKPLTVVYPGAMNIAENLISQDGSIGIRVVNDKFCQGVINRLNKPIVSTSANISGERSPQLFREIDSKIRLSVDYIVKYRQDELVPRKPSGIIKLGVNGEVKVIRE